jgi:hypothetical protein
MTTSSDTVRLPSADESIAPVTILDAQGRVLRVVSAEEFRRARATTTAKSFDGERLLASMRIKRAQRRRDPESPLVSASAGSAHRAVAS